MKVKLARHLKSTSEESATIELTWDPSDEEADRAAGLIATLADFLEKYLEIKAQLDKYSDNSR